MFFYEFVRLTDYLYSDFKLDSRVSKKTSNIIDATNNLLFKSNPLDMHIAIDESTIPHKGRCGALVYNKTKPNRWEIKVYILFISESGYVYRFKLHTEEKTSISETVNYLTD
ncbi:PiggyBac transposable element-derived protein 4 [Cucumispora dikerogammari]|nr:PiggyBac transposable element-derived protein 4 [Cucumispora dikerogammari]